jgi:hypothetical protein
MGDYDLLYQATTAVLRITQAVIVAMGYRAGATAGGYLSALE